jgi:hypothetical protein
MFTMGSGIRIAAGREVGVLQLAGSQGFTTAREYKYMCIIVHYFSKGWVQDLSPMMSLPKDLATKKDKRINSRLGSRGREKVSRDRRIEQCGKSFKSADLLRSSKVTQSMANFRVCERLGERSARLGLRKGTQARTLLRA